MAKMEAKMKVQLMLISLKIQNKNIYKRSKHKQPMSKIIVLKSNTISTQSLIKMLKKEEKLGGKGNRIN
ncbi:hypothetical protein [Clostridium uliginosum]|uniref:hypothetical protein n=1 Tax=Clostridium uliginosum TaxID=119641 RepID=UPI000B7FB89D|nr:hypothetical protein [Clostridium uliginosum]